MNRSESPYATVVNGSRGRRWRWWVAAIVVQALTVIAYVAVFDHGVTAIRYLLYPFVWIDVGVWAMLRVTPNPGAAKHRLAAGAISAVYLAAMLFVAGFLGFGNETMTGWRIVSAPPGWGPMIAYQGAWLRLYLVPFQVIGYVALAYLLYAALLDATRAALSGVFGLVSCVGCTWTLISPLVVGAFGTASTVGATLYAWSYDLTTLVFLGTVGLLVRTIERRSG